MEGVTKPLSIMHNNFVMDIILLSIIHNIM